MQMLVKYTRNSSPGIRVMPRLHSSQNECVEVSGICNENYIVSHGAFSENSLSTIVNLPRCFIKGMFVTA